MNIFYSNLLCLYGPNITNGLSVLYSPHNTTRSVLRPEEKGRNLRKTHRKEVSVLPGTDRPADATYATSQSYTLCWQSLPHHHTGSLCTFSHPHFSVNILTPLFMWAFNLCKYVYFIWMCLICLVCISNGESQTGQQEKPGRFDISVQSLISDNLRWTFGVTSSSSAHYTVKTDASSVGYVVHIVVELASHRDTLTCY